MTYEIKAPTFECLDYLEFMESISVVDQNFAQTTTPTYCTYSIIIK